MAKNKYTLEQLSDPGFIREELMKQKSSAVWKIFMELDGLINISKFAKKYFKKSHSWFLQKLWGYEVRDDKNKKFTAEEYAKIAESFRELARQLNEYADAIDKAEE